MPAAAEHAEAGDLAAGDTMTRAAGFNLHHDSPGSFFVRVLGPAWRSLFPVQRFLHERDTVSMPPAELRAAGPLFRDDTAFQGFAIADIKSIERHTSLAGKTILDFGCGAGRLYFGFRRRNEPDSYLGVDVKRDVIDWAQRHISVSNQRFTFVRSDVQNDRYNPEGTLANSAWVRLLNSPFDVIYCYSVLSHLTEVDAAAVLKLFADFSRSASFVFLTAFVAEQEENVAINPEGAGIAIQGPLHVVRYRHDYFRDNMLRRFAVVAEYPSLATDGQTLFVLRRR